MIRIKKRVMMTQNVNRTDNIKLHIYVYIYICNIILSVLLIVGVIITLFFILIMNSMDIKEGESQQGSDPSNGS